MAKPLVPAADTLAAGLGDELPKPGDYDDIDPDDVELIARGPALVDGRQFMLTVTVPLEMESLHAIVQAARADGMDAAEYIQQAVRRMAEALRNPKPVP
jgi:hypothetical protein